METGTLTRRRFTVDDCHRVAEAGILSEDDRVELIGGKVVQMTPIDGRRMHAVNTLTRLMVQSLTGADPYAEVRVRNPARLGDGNESVPGRLRSAFVSEHKMCHPADATPGGERQANEWAETCRHSRSLHDAAPPSRGRFSLS